MENYLNIQLFEKGNIFHKNILCMLNLMHRNELKIIAIEYCLGLNRC